jgi:serine/threonine protein kinase/Tol biopolymer transport system component
VACPLPIPLSTPLPEVYLTRLAPGAPNATVLVTLIGRYEVVGLLGEGGMGRVYRARDTQLGRMVAVKVLPQAFAADVDYLRRFEQEARAAAALSHPGIMAVYDVGVHDGAPYLVSELLEGVTLRERLTAGRISFDMFLDFSTQVAEALAAAHAKGIVHRDLKPENLFVCPGDRIKILDFGLAKLTAAAVSDRVDVTGAPPPIVATLPHTVLGTPGYMPPEQARGDMTDHRADLFSFGCVAYEMLEGRRPFEGSTPADVIGSILKDSPKSLTSSIERPLPPALDSIVQRCLAKEPSARFQSASDLAFALHSVSIHGRSLVEFGVRPRDHKRSWRTALPWSLAATGVTALAAFLAFGGGDARVTGKSSRVEFLIPPPTEDQLFAPMPLPGLIPTAPQVGVSPDGSRVAFVTADPGGKRQLWIRSIDASRPRAVDGTEGANAWPFWSPDSRFVVIAVGRMLVKIDAHSGTVENLTTLPEQAPPVPFVTGSWNDAGTILFSIGGVNGIYRTPAIGGAARAVTQLDTTRGDQYHSWPQLLSGDRFLLFIRTDNAETNGVYAGDLTSSDLTKIHANASRAVYANGHLLWTIGDRLVAQPFDAASLALTGQPATVVPSVFQGAGRTAAFWMSNANSLIYAGGDTRERQFHTVTRDGAAIGTVGPPGLYVTFDASADLSKLVVEVSKDTTARFSTLAFLDTTRGVLAPLTLGDQNDTDPRFGPGGAVVFARNSKDGPGIAQIDPSSGRATIVLPRGQLPVLWMEDWSPDGSSIVYRSAANRDAWQLSKGQTEPQRLTEARNAIEQVQLSPDRRWIAYNTTETGRSEVFISSVSPGGQRWQASAAGGVQPTWRTDGRELYFLGLDGGLYSVGIAQSGNGLITNAPRLLFRTRLPVISAVVEQYRPSGDGQRFLFCLPLTSVRREPLRMLLNWPTALAERR